MRAEATDSPVGGWNAFDSMDNMPPTDAVILDNWVPRSGYCESRSGFLAFSDDLGGPVLTLSTFRASGSGGSQLIAGANGKLIDITSGGAGTELGTGFTDDRWQTAHFKKLLLLVNGADACQSFDGTTLTPMAFTISDGLDPPSQIPFDNDRFIGVTTFKGRAFYWEEASQSFYFCDVGSFQGEVFEFDLSTVLSVGGNIKSIFSWTNDAGTGPDDLLCIIFDTGELLLYQGDDPSSVSFWEIVGRFLIPDPLSIRCHVKYGSDVIIMTRDGYVNLTTILREEAESDYPAYSRKIARAVYEYGNLYFDNYGHEPVVTENGYLIFNVPTGSETAVQVFQNPKTGAWSRFVGMNAATWELLDPQMYFGGWDGVVYRVTGESDNGEPMFLAALPAFNTFGDVANQKHLTAVQVVSNHPDPMLIDVKGFADYNYEQLTGVGVLDLQGGGTLWNTEKWNTFYWSRGSLAEFATTKVWQNAHAFGFAVTAAIQMKVRGQRIVWRLTNYRLKPAGAH